MKSGIWEYRKSSHPSQTKTALDHSEAAFNFSYSIFSDNDSGASVEARKTHPNLSVK